MNIEKFCKNRLQEDWLIGYEINQLSDLFEQKQEDFKQLYDLQNYPNVIIAEAEPLKFIAAFWAGITTNCNLFLGNPNWVESEWKQVLNLVKPDLIVGKDIYSYCLHNPKSQNPKLVVSEANPFKIQNLIMIPTGGSAGKIRFAMHTWDNLTASVTGFCQYFEVKEVNSFCVLPLYHVSGLMQLLRSFLSGGKLAIQTYNAVKCNQILALDYQNFFISLVPTQLQFLLANQPEFLSRFKTVLLGGAPACSSLLEQTKQAKINLAPTYGMTETASQIVTLKPKDFHQGNYSSGQVLPHTQVIISSDNDKTLDKNKIGLIKIKSDSLYLGYYPEYRQNQDYFITDDLGYFDEDNYLYIVGRNSQKIITGGENVYPQEVEKAILDTQLVKDVAIIALSHPQWGEVVTAVYVAKDSAISLDLIKTAIQNQLSKYKQPKYWLELDDLHRNQQGKINYNFLKDIALRTFQLS